MNMEKINDKARETESLTIEQALEKGYTKCGYDNIDFQHLKDIDELDADDFSSHYNGELVIADTENPVTWGISGEDIAALITDKINDQEDINDEDGMMIHYLDEYKELEADLDVIAQKINGFIGKHKIYYLTDIKLINPFSDTQSQI